MNDMIERYIGVTLDSIPERQRAEVGTEIRAAIDEIVEQRLENGEPEHVAVRAALEELGDPRNLAQAYRDSPQYLIGPGWYPLYIEVLKRVLPIVVVVVAVISTITGIAAEDARLLDAVFGAAWSAVWTALQFFFWATLGFVIAERTAGDPPSLLSKGRWTVDDLPEAPASRQIGLGETVGTVLTLVVLGTLVVVQQSRGVGFFIFGGENGDWDSLPLINLDLGFGWALGFVAVMTMSVMVAVAGYLERAYTFRFVVLTAVEAVLWIAYVVALAASEPIVNPEFARRVSDGGGSWWAAGNQANRIVAIVIIAYSLWDVWEAWTRYRGNRNISQMAALAA